MEDIVAAAPNDHAQPNPEQAEGSMTAGDRDLDVFRKTCRSQLFVCRAIMASDTVRTLIRVVFGQA